jgi:hypothetical protein
VAVTVVGTLRTVVISHQRLWSFRITKFSVAGFLATETLQHGHRCSVLTSARINRQRMLAIELGTWRSVRSGGAFGSTTLGNGRLREEPGGTRSSNWITRADRTTPMKGGMSCCVVQHSQLIIGKWFGIRGRLSLSCIVRYGIFAPVHPAPGRRYSAQSACRCVPAGYGRRFRSANRRVRQVRY